MKHPIRSATVLLTAALAATTFTACSKSERTEVAEKTTAVVQDTKASLAQTWTDLKAATYEKRADTAQHVNALQARFAAQASQLRADYSAAQASASRKAAMDTLSGSEADFQRKAAALGTATADTWDSAKAQVSAAWDKLQADYEKARAEK